ncbi:MAG: hypothetical protein PWP62_1778 [Eubacteriaceae bacterium]|nr:hypothetical protein [Eubacteriaceae bacterium]
MPVTTSIDQLQYYSGPITWYKIKDANGDSTGPNPPVMAGTDTFEASCVYQAAFALTACDGYTFNGLEANHFSYAGADSVSNNAVTDSLSLVDITITFPAIVAEPSVFTVQKATYNGAWGAFQDANTNGPEPEAGYQIFGIAATYILEVNTDASKNGDTLGDTKYNTLGSDGNWSLYSSKTVYEPEGKDYPLAGGNSAGSIWTYDTSALQPYLDGAAYYQQGSDTIYYTNFNDAPYSANNIKDMPLLGSCSAIFASNGMSATYFVFQDAANNQLLLANADSNLNDHEVVKITAPTIPAGYKICGFTSEGEGSAATTTVYICNASQAYQR